MKLLIGTDGFVEEAELVGDPVGNGFDELALSAARRSLFEPATRDGVPMRARVMFRYDFVLPQAAAEPEPEAPTTGQLELRVLKAEGDAAVDKAIVLVSRKDDPSFARRVETDAEGRAILTELPAGVYQVRVDREGLATEEHEEEIAVSQATEVTYRMRTLETDEWSFGAVARVKAPPREVTRRTIEREVLTRVAGTRGDALRTIELLPGVSRPPFGAGIVLIRGSAPGDSQVFLEGVPVNLLYHFGGLTSFINSRVLERIDFYPGNFSVRYGRQIGGIIDVGIRDPASDGYHGVLDVNVPLDSSLLLEGPLGDKASFLVGGRRSYFGEVLTTVIPPEAGLASFPAPVYYDYQSFVTWRPTDRDKLRFGIYGSSDRLEVLFANAPDADPSIRAIEVGVQFHRQQIGWTHQYSPRLDHNVQVSFGRIDQNFNAGPSINFDLSVNNVYARAEWRYRISDRVQLTTGTDTFVDAFEVKYTGPAPEQQEGNAGGGSLSAREPTSIRDKRSRTQPSIYTELSLKPIDALQLIPGLRVDYFEEIEAFAFDPRLAAIYSLTDAWRIKGGVGVFSQAPEPQETSPTFIGNPNLQPIRSVHYSAGVEHDLAEDFSLGTEGFYKQVYQRVVTPDRSEDSRPFVNDGIGRIYGLEVSGRKNASGRWFGFLSYTLMRSERNDRNEGWRLFDFDQTHILTVAATYRLGRGWELGGTFRVVTGNPQTPVAGGIYDADTGLYTPVPGRINATRAGTFNRLDVRLEKTWIFDSWRMAAYLDVQNAYNAQNPEGTNYSFNLRQSEVLRGLPIIPIIGVRGEL
jgi:outer membrane receptor for ferrienterochelin and colicin